MDSFFINYLLTPEGGATASLKILFSILFMWSIIWKGIALWRASRYLEIRWFIAILILNTAGILEIAYLFYFSKNKMTTQQLLTFVKTFNLKKIKTLFP